MRTVTQSRFAAASPSHSLATLAGLASPRVRHRAGEGDRPLRLGEEAAGRRRRRARGPSAPRDPREGAGRRPLPRDVRGGRGRAQGPPREGRDRQGDERQLRPAARPRRRRHGTRREEGALLLGRALPRRTTRARPFSPTGSAPSSRTTTTRSTTRASLPARGSVSRRARSSTSPAAPAATTVGSSGRSTCRAASASSRRATRRAAASSKTSSRSRCGRPASRRPPRKKDLADPWVEAPPLVLPGGKTIALDVKALRASVARRGRGRRHRPRTRLPRPQPLRGPEPRGAPEVVAPVRDRSRPPLRRRHGERRLPVALLGRGDPPLALPENVVLVDTEDGKPLLRKSGRLEVRRARRLLRRPVGAERLRDPLRRRSLKSREAEPPSVVCRDDDEASHRRAGAAALQAGDFVARPRSKLSGPPPRQATKRKSTE